MRKETRKIKNSKPLIYVFCEGESEQVYTQFLKEEFKDVAVIKWHKETGLFEEAESNFKKNPGYRDNIQVTDEIWFFFDVEEVNSFKTKKWFDIIRRLRKLRKKPEKNIRVRLLMTKACIEYWLMLHYEMCKPPLVTKADKDRMFKNLQKKIPEYEKGDLPSTKKIAANYPVAVINGEKTLKDLLGEGIPTLEDCDERNKWLNQSSSTFTTVQEAIQFLEERRLQDNKQ